MVAPVWNSSLSELAGQFSKAFTMMRQREIQKHHKNGNNSGNQSNNRKLFQLMLKILVWSDVLFFSCQSSFRRAIHDVEEGCTQSLVFIKRFSSLISSSQGYWVLLCFLCNSFSSSNHKEMANLASLLNFLFSHSQARYRACKTMNEKGELSCN